MTEHLIWVADGAAVATMIAATVADWRRGRRTNLDAVGWVPWGTVQIAALFAAVALTVLGLHQ